MTIGTGQTSQAAVVEARGIPSFAVSLIVSLGVLALLAAACGSEVASVDAGSESVIAEPTSAELAQAAIADATVGIEGKESEIGTVALAQLEFAESNPEVCPDEFASFNQPYPEDRAEAAKLDEGIEDRGQAIVTCLIDAGEGDLADDLALLTAWSRHLADNAG